MYTQTPAGILRDLPLHGDVLVLLVWLPGVLMSHIPFCEKVFMPGSFEGRIGLEGKRKDEKGEGEGLATLDSGLPELGRVWKDTGGKYSDEIRE